MLALELEREKEQEKLEEEIALKEVLKEQMNELRSREMEVSTSSGPCFYVASRVA